MAWLKHSYASQLPKTLYSEQSPDPVSKPEMVLYNESLALELGIAELLSEQKAVAYLSGNETVPGSQPISQAYAGHQFGHFTRLGDGRAVLLGELENHQGPYDPGGDGRCSLQCAVAPDVRRENVQAGT